MFEGNWKGSGREIYKDIKISEEIIIYYYDIEMEIIKLSDKDFNIKIKYINENPEYNYYSDMLAIAKDNCMPLIKPKKLIAEDSTGNGINYFKVINDKLYFTYNVNGDPDFGSLIGRFCLYRSC